MPENPPPIIIQQPTRTEYVTREVTVTEKRAPTDASVALLREMEEAAKAKIIDAIHLADVDTGFECVVHIERIPISDCTLLRAVFKIGGKAQTVEHEFRPRKRDDETAALVALRDKVAVVIAGRMLEAAFQKMHASVWGRRDLP